jgi:hypothetical protein
LDSCVKTGLADAMLASRAVVTTKRLKLVCVMLADRTVGLVKMKEK